MCIQREQLQGEIPAGGVLGLNGKRDSGRVHRTGERNFGTLARSNLCLFCLSQPNDDLLKVRGVTSACQPSWSVPRDLWIRLASLASSLMLHPARLPSTHSPTRFYLVLREEQASIRHLRDLWGWKVSADTFFYPFLHFSIWWELNS